VGRRIYGRSSRPEGGIGAANNNGLLDATETWIDVNYRRRPAGAGESKRSS
jgi:hypothetical protein